MSSDSTENNMSENLATTPEVPASAPVQTENQTPPSVQSAAAPPPAANLVVNGTRSEREIQLERDLQAARDAQRRAEFVASEKEREVETLKAASISPPPPKPKRKPHWSDPIFPR